MFAIAFSALAVIALIANVFYFVMRIRLVRLDTARDRIEWLTIRGSDDVLETYEALFPTSVLPRFCRFAFWAFIALATVVAFTLAVSKTFAH
jgi:hypothetical protein